MFEIFSKTDNKTIRVSPDSTVLESMLKANINHIYVCGGNSRCTTCRISIMDGLSNCRPRNEKEKQVADKFGFPQDIRLACQTKIMGNITIRCLVVDELAVRDEYETQGGGDCCNTYSRCGSWNRGVCPPANRCAILSR